MMNRGYAPESMDKSFDNFTYPGLLHLLNSKIPSERTVSARILSKKQKRLSIKYLCEALEREKEFYTRTELCDALAAFGIRALPQLTDRIGTIKTKQYEYVKMRNKKEEGFPLPRDPVTRTMIRSGKDALPYLLKALYTDDASKVSEAIDGLGYICYHEKYNSPLSDLIVCHNKWVFNELIRWKVFRALRAFPFSKNFLKSRLTKEISPKIKAEIEKSLGAIDQYKLTQNF